jgi:hypothetical protein
MEVSRNYVSAGDNDTYVATPLGETSPLSLHIAVKDHKVESIVIEDRTDDSPGETITLYERSYGAPMTASSLLSSLELGINLPDDTGDSSFRYIDSILAKSLTIDTLRTTIIALSKMFGRLGLVTTTGSYACKVQLSFLRGEGDIEYGRFHVRADNEMLNLDGAIHGLDKFDASVIVTFISNGVPEAWK